MAEHVDWDPRRYLRFSRERALPSYDLVAKIEVERPRDVLDLGCGPGNSARAILERWPEARLTGVDSSDAMIRGARETLPTHRWEVREASSLDFGREFDVVFSNAALQWIPRHETLLPGLLSYLREGGVLAMQLPRYDCMPVCGLVDEVYRSVTGDSSFSYETIFTFHEPAFYDDLLRPRGERFALWETTYFHLMSSHDEIWEMLASTGLPPYFERLPDSGLRSEFERGVREGLRRVYPTQSDGAVLFPFRRLFFTVMPKAT